MSFLKEVLKYQLFHSSTPQISELIVSKFCIIWIFVLTAWTEIMWKSLNDFGKYHINIPGLHYKQIFAHEIAK